MSLHPVVPLLLTTLAMLGIAACEQASSPTPSETQPRLVRTLVVTPTNGSIWREFPGVVDAAKKADLGFRVAGRLVTLAVREGDSVKSGDVLAQLDETDFRIQLASREAEYTSAHADYLRGRELVKTGVISRSDYNKLQAQNATAKANLEAARQNLEYTRLRAPFDGRIAVRHVDSFEELNAKQTVYTLQDTSSLLVKINLPESLMIRVREGARPEVYASFNELPDQRFPLRFKEVATRADENTNTFVVTFAMQEHGDYNILPGMSATVRGKPPTKRMSASSVLHVPAHAVLEDDVGRFLYSVESVSDGRGVVQRRAVETGNLSALGLEVTSGLEVGDRIVTAGMSKMRAGLEVRLATASTE